MKAVKSDVDVDNFLFYVGSQKVVKFDDRTRRECDQDILKSQEVQSHVFIIMLKQIPSEGMSIARMTEDGISVEKKESTLETII